MESGKSNNPNNTSLIPTATEAVTHIRVKVIAHAKREQVSAHKGVLSISVKEPAQDNAANRRVVQLVAKHFRVPTSSVRIIAGHHKPNKTFSIKEK